MVKTKTKNDESLLTVVTTRMLQILPEVPRRVLVIRQAFPLSGHARQFESFLVC